MQASPEKSHDRLATTFFAEYRTGLADHLPRIARPYLRRTAAKLRERHDSVSPRLLHGEASDQLRASARAAASRRLSPPFVSYSSPPCSQHISTSSSTLGGRTG